MSHENEITARIFTGASESIRRLNPHVFSMAGRLRPKKPKPDGRGQGQDSGVDGDKKGVGYCITLVSYRRRIVDAHDNLKSANKNLVDRITAFLGFEADNDKRLTWEYGQVETKGRQGVSVKIEKL